jgi:hypothetical protein
MPNCEEPGCKVYVVAEGILCRVHQQEGETPEIRVTYNGAGIVQLSQGNFTKGTTGKVTKAVAAELKKDKDWTVED